MSDIGIAEARRGKAIEALEAQRREAQLVIAAGPWDWNGAVDPHKALLIEDLKARIGRINEEIEALERLDDAQLIETYCPEVAAAKAYQATPAHERPGLTDALTRGASVSPVYVKG